MSSNYMNCQPPAYVYLTTIADSEADQPGARCGHTLTPVYADNRHRLVLFGGSIPDESRGSSYPMTSFFGVTNSVHSFDISTRKWTRLNPAGESPSPRAGHAAASMGSFVAIQGGVGLSGLCEGDLYLLDLTSTNLMWYRVPGPNPGPRYGHVMDLVSHRLILFGGMSERVHLQDTWALDTTRRPYAWERLNPSGHLPCSRMYASASARDDGIFVLCGGRDHLGVTLGDAYGLKLDTFGQWTWKRLPSNSTSQRYQHAAVFVGPRYHVIGGALSVGCLVNGEAANAVFDTISGDWLVRNGPDTFMRCSYVQNQNQLMRRSRHAVASVGNHIYVYGGLREGVLLDGLLVAEDFTISQASSSSQQPFQSGLRRSLSDNSLERRARDVDSNSPTVQTDFEASVEEGYAQLQRRSVPIPGNFGTLVRQRSLDQSNNESRRPTPSLRDAPMPQVFKNSNEKSTQELRKRVISTLLKPRDWKPPTNRVFFLSFDEISNLCHDAEQIFMREPTVLQLKAPIKVFGDIHGQFGDLMRIFSEYGSPSIEGDITYIDYLFLGDYVDRGQHSLETIMLLLTLKIEYPKYIHLIRGNHESSNINITLGFYQECNQRMGKFFGVETWTRINRLFIHLPLAALIEKKIFCMHGGIGKSVLTVEQVAQIQRPVYMDYATDVIRDLLWSDPTQNDSILGIEKSVRGPNVVTFGPDIVKAFCERNKIDFILRGHECVRDGIERFAEGRLITVFSATNYCGFAKNAGAIMVIGRDLVMVPKLIHPNPPPLEKKSSEDSPVKALMEELNEDLPSSPVRGLLRSEESTAFSFTFDTTASSSNS